MGKYILVTGSSRGIGEETALYLAKSGFNIVLHCNSNLEKANILKEKVKSFGVDARVLQFDVKNRKQCFDVLTKDISENGIYYGVVLNAGIAKDNVFPVMEENEWDDVIDTNEATPETIEEYTPKYDVAELQATYPNAWGILEKPDGTAFPIAETNSREEEDYYLKHTLDGNYSVSGTVFLDHQNDKDMNNQVSRIWGHNLLGENMLGNLTEYQNQGQTFYDQNKTYTLYTEKGVYELDVFAALEEDGTTQEFDYENQDAFLQDMNNNKNASNFVSDVQVSPDDQVIILECCPDRGSAISGNNRFSVYTKVTPVYEYNLNNNKTL